MCTTYFISQWRAARRVIDIFHFGGILYIALRV